MGDGESPSDERGAQPCSRSGDALVDAPPWSVPRFDVKKKPPPVPKPRYVIAKPPSPSVEHSVEAKTLLTKGLSASSLSADRPRWGQLGESSCSKPPIIKDVSHALDDSVNQSDTNGPTSVGLQSPSVSSTHAVAASPRGRAVADDYKSSWHRWRSMPSSLEDKLQELMRPSPPQQFQPPSKEALDFLESLLSGTEPSAPSVPKKSTSTCATAARTAQVVDNAERIRAQAESARRKRTEAECSRPQVPCSVRADSVGSPARRTQCADAGQSSAASSRPSRRAKTHGMQDSPRDPKDSPRGPKAASPPPQAEAAGRARGQSEGRGVREDREAACDDDPSHGTDFERRMRAKEEEHKRRLRELEEEMEREQEQLLKEMRRDHAEQSARRQAQAEWQKEHRRQAEFRKSEAERSSRQREQAQAREEEAWKNRWWKNWQRSEEKAKQKMEEQKQWSQQWWEQWQAKDEEEDYEYEEEDPLPSHSGTTSGSSARPQAAHARDRGTGAVPPPLPVPPPPGAAAKAATVEQTQVLEQLCSNRREPVEERKRIWRQLCLQWHPDKCGDKAGATVMFQFLQGLKDWFLAPK